MRHERDGLAAVARRVIEAFQGMVHLAAIVPRRAVGWRQFDGAIVTGQGSFKAGVFVQHTAAVVVELREIRRERNRPLIACQRVIQAAAALVGVAQVAVEMCVRRVERNRFLDMPMAAAYCCLCVAMTPCRCHQSTSSGVCASARSHRVCACSSFPFGNRVYGVLERG